MTRRINPNEKSGKLATTKRTVILFHNVYFLLIHQPEERPRHFKFPSKLNAIQSFSDIDIGNGDWSNLVCIVDRILYARKGEDVTSQAVNLGGDKISVEEAIVSRGETFSSWHSRLVGSDKYLVFNLHQHPLHTAHSICSSDKFTILSQ